VIIVLERFGANMKATYKEGKALDYILLYTDCRNVSEAIGYLNGMYNEGMTIDEILSYFEATKPSFI
tara:strand:- start:4746 stop:4946 length:201 start_codon:yes stop_codon:yes gene_type:complete